jgi:hypothetical protein
MTPWKVVLSEEPKGITNVSRGRKQGKIIPIEKTGQGRRKENAPRHEKQKKNITSFTLTPRSGMCPANPVPEGQGASFPSFCEPPHRLSPYLIDSLRKPHHL